MNEINFISAGDDAFESSAISFHIEEINFELHDAFSIELWIRSVIQSFSCRLNYVHFIFCSDKYLHRLNVSYLQHDTLTDVITFPYASPPHIEGDIYISIERVQENALIYRVSFEEELLRVIIHGILHLCGLTDSTEAEKEEMHQKENEALKQYVCHKYPENQQIQSKSSEIN
jgi:rRNA maturation RNase YbeY